MIPKASGGERPLGIPTVKDRVVQAAVKLVLEPIFEADFTDTAYGYRPHILDRKVSFPGRDPDRKNRWTSTPGRGGRDFREAQAA